MSSADRKVPLQARSTVTPAVSRRRRASRVTTASSIGGVAPSPLTSSATRAPAPSPRVVEDRGQQRIDERARRGGLGLLHARLAVDAEAEFDLVRFQREARATDGRQRAGAEGHAHGAEVRRGLTRDGRHLG